MIPLPRYHGPTFTEDQNRTFPNLPAEVGWVIATCLHQSVHSAPAHLKRLTFLLYGSQVTNPGPRSDWDLLVHSESSWEGTTYKGQELQQYVPGVGTHFVAFDGKVDITLTELPLQGVYPKIYSTIEGARVCILMPDAYPDPKTLQNPAYLDGLRKTMGSKGQPLEFGGWQWKEHSCIPELSVPDLSTIGDYCYSRKIVLHPNPAQTIRAVFRWARASILNGFSPGTWEMLQKIHDETFNEMIRFKPQKFAAKMDRIANVLFRGEMSKDQKRQYALFFIDILFSVSDKKDELLGRFQNHFLALLDAFGVHQDISRHERPRAHMWMLQKRCAHPGLSKEVYASRTLILVGDIATNTNLSDVAKRWLIRTVTKGHPTIDAVVLAQSPQTLEALNLRYRDDWTGLYIAACVCENSSLQEYLRQKTAALGISIDDSFKRPSLPEAAQPLPVASSSVATIRALIQSNNPDKLKTWVIENRWVFNNYDPEHQALSALIPKGPDKTEHLEEALFSCSEEGVPHYLKNEKELPLFLERLRSIPGTDWGSVLSWTIGYENTCPVTVKILKNTIVVKNSYLTMEENAMFPSGHFGDLLKEAVEGVTEDNIRDFFGKGSSGSSSDSDD